MKNIGLNNHQKRRLVHLAQVETQLEASQQLNRQRIWILQIWKLKLKPLDSRPRQKVPLLTAALARYWLRTESLNWKNWSRTCFQRFNWALEEVCKWKETTTYWIDNKQEEQKILKSWNCQVLFLFDYKQCDVNNLNNKSKYKYF